ncbi:MAG: hypothetical protein H6705_02010 [Myxococcales bacterium]|nr:hypothetical protein [Myxococcales bacterium]
MSRLDDDALLGPAVDARVRALLDLRQAEAHHRAAGLSIWSVCWRDRGLAYQGESTGSDDESVAGGADSRADEIVRKAIGAKAWLAGGGG